MDARRARPARRSADEGASGVGALFRPAGDLTGQRGAEGMQESPGEGHRGDVVHEQREPISNPLAQLPSATTPRGRRSPADLRARPSVIAGTLVAAGAGPSGGAPTWRRGADLDGPLSGAGTVAVQVTAV